MCNAILRSQSAATRKKQAAAAHRSAAPLDVMISRDNDAELLKPVTARYQATLLSTANGVDDARRSARNAEAGNGIPNR